MTKIRKQGWEVERLLTHPPPSCVVSCTTQNAAFFGDEGWMAGVSAAIGPFFAVKMVEIKKFERAMNPSVTKSSFNLRYDGLFFLQGKIKICASRKSVRRSLVVLAYPFRQRRVNMAGPSQSGEQKQSKTR